MAFQRRRKRRGVPFTIPHVLIRFDVRRYEVPRVREVQRLGSEGTTISEASDRPPSDSLEGSPQRYVLTARRNASVPEGDLSVGKARQAAQRVLRRAFHLFVQCPRFEC